MTTPRRADWPRWAVLLMVWSGFGFVATALHHTSYTLSRGTLSWTTSLALQMPIALAWALATPAIQRLGVRFPLTRARWRASLLVHLTACAALVSLLVVGYVLLSARLLPPATQPVPPMRDRVLQLLAAWALTDGILYATVLSVTAVLDQQKRLREREVLAVQLEAELAQAELRAMKMQLHPHFLFNSLHTIGALVRTGDRETTIRVVTHLGDLLRRVVDGVSGHEVPLDQELGLLRSYLAIEAVRFRDRLTVELAIDQDTLDVMVPHLILQPLVENAIRHGIEPHPGPGHIAIRARRENGHLELSVRNSGAADGTGRVGVGLTNTRTRLTRLYGAAGAMRSGRAPGGGWEVSVSVPCRTSETEDRGQ